MLSKHRQQTCPGHSETLRDTPAASHHLHGKHWWCVLHFSLSNSYTALIGPGLDRNSVAQMGSEIILVHNIQNHQTCPNQPRPVQNMTGRTGRRQTCCSLVSFTGKEQRHEHLQRCNLQFLVSTLEFQQPSLCLYQLCFELVLNKDVCVFISVKPEAVNWQLSNIITFKSMLV